MSKDYKVAVLTSGGLDSLIAHRRAVYDFGKDNVVAVFVNYGQPYYAKELAAVERLHRDDNLIRVTADCAHPHLFNVPTVEQQEVYGRNFLLAYYGALVAERVWMVALSTEINPHAVRDKQPEFFQLTSGMFSFLLKNKRMQTIVESPFAHFTKSEEVAHGKAIGVTCEEILASVSCYDPDAQNCGQCSTCFKRWVALTNNGITEKYAKSVVHPKLGLRNYYGIHTVAQMQAMGDEPDDWRSRYSMARRIETHNALVRAKQTGIWPSRGLILNEDPNVKP